MLKLSIIIPVYNVEKYIRKCIESCLNQNLPKDEYEIIVVIDGSPDNSAGIVEEIIRKEYQEKDYCNIRIITRENGGLSAARNTGLKVAKGEYVWFVDSDDWIETNILTQLVESIYENNLDVLCFNFRFVYENDLSVDNIIANPNGIHVYNGESFICNVRMPVMAWLAIYKIEYLLKNDLCFFEGIIHEDQEFTPRAYCLAQRIMLVDIVGYNYLQRDGGIMKTNQNSRRCKDFLSVSDSLYSFAVKNLIKGSEAYDIIMEKIAFVFTQSLAYYNSTIFPISHYYQREYYPLYIGSYVDAKSRWKYKLVNFSIKVYLLMYKILK